MDKGKCSVVGKHHTGSSVLACGTAHPKLWSIKDKPRSQVQMGLVDSRATACL